MFSGVSNQLRPRTYKRACQLSLNQIVFKKKNSLKNSSINGNITIMKVMVVSDQLHLIYFGAKEYDGGIDRCTRIY